MFLIQGEPFQCYFSSEGFSDTVLTSEERLLTRNWTLKRIRDFSTGRYCARKALTRFNMDNADILIGSNREPIWPKGITGSISHCENLVGAITARTDELRAVGLDVEIIGEVSGDVWELVFTDNELSFLYQLSPEELKVYSTVIFSAKECFYKLQFPLTKMYIDFKDVEITIQGRDLRLTLIKGFEDITSIFDKIVLKFITYTSNVITYGYLN